jgi:hypothetical protein
MTTTILSRCHETEVEWTPELLSPIKLRAALELCSYVGARKPEQVYFPEPKKPVQTVSKAILSKPRKRDKPGYVKPMLWTPQQSAELRKWYRQQRPTLTRGERMSDGARTVLI